MSKPENRRRRRSARRARLANQVAEALCPSPVPPGWFDGLPNRPDPDVDFRRLAKIYET